MATYLPMTATVVPFRTAPFTLLRFFLPLSLSLSPVVPLLTFPLLSILVQVLECSHIVSYEFE